MGSLTASSIISAGLNLAGNTGLTSQALTWLSAWLKRAYASHPWAYKRAVTTGTLSTSTYTFTLSVGHVLDIRRIVLANPAPDDGFRQELELQHDEQAEKEDIAELMSVDSRSGLPTKAFISESVPGNMAVRLNRYPDKAYRYAAFLQYSELDLELSTVPEYPADDTMIHVVYVQALRHQDDPRYADEYKVLRQMMAEDKLVHGKKRHSPPTLGLARHRYKQRR